MPEHLIEDLQAVGKWFAACSGRRTVAQLAKLTQVHFDGRQRLSDLIVQIPGDRATFQLLDFHQPSGEDAQAAIGVAQCRRAFRDTMLQFFMCGFQRFLHPFLLGNVRIQLETCAGCAI